MNAETTAIRPRPASTGGVLLGALRTLLLLEAATALALTIFLSMLASGIEGGLGEPSAATTIRFAAGGAFIFSILALATARGVRRRRGWAWTLAAVLQVVMAVGTGIAVMSADLHPLFVIGFVLPVAVMLALSATSTRRALGQL